MLTIQCLHIIKNSNDFALLYTNTTRAHAVCTHYALPRVALIASVLIMQYNWVKPAGATGNHTKKRTIDRRAVSLVKMGCFDGMSRWLLHLIRPKLPL